jgi:hypothetical protein
MNKLTFYIRELFKKSESSKPETPFLHEILDLSKFDQGSFDSWSEDESAIILKNKLKSAFLFYEIHKKSQDSGIEFWLQPLSKGFILFSNPDNTSIRSNFINFQYSIYLLLKNKGYFLNLADVQSRKKGDWIEMVRRFYMKPSLRFRSGRKARQLFGNIHLEYVERDGKPYMFRLLANSYQDQNFHQEEDFKDLVLLITS